MNFQHLQKDIPSGLVVFLVALPLCLGIALASGAPLFAGIISGIIGGIVIAIFSGSELSVSGPAAGLAVIVASTIESFGSYPSFLVCVVLAGVFQLILGTFKAGVVANYFPSSVIKGMLAAIGVVIFLKQIPHALGRDADFEGDLWFNQFFDGENTFTEILLALQTYSVEAVMISIISLGILLVWQLPFFKNHPILSLTPAPLIVVIFGIVANSMFLLVNGYGLTSHDGHLVLLPVSDSFSSFIGQFTFPDFSNINIVQVIQASFTIAIVASIETLLSVEAVDKLDPMRRISDSNKELRAQGIGNIVSGFIGGLPITSVIVRSSANVYAGAITKLSAFVHGVLLLLCVAFIPSILNKIPLACLAAILLVIGYKLAPISLFKEMYQAGYQQFLPFLITVLAVVFTDLLTGIFIGSVVGLFFLIQKNHHDSITLVHDKKYYLLHFNKDLSFVNKAQLKTALRSIPNDSQLLIDAKNALFIDDDIFDVIHDFEHLAKHKNIQIEYKHFFTKEIPLFIQKQDHHGRVQKTTTSE